jgi:hypothetical protein
MNTTDRQKLERKLRHVLKNDGYLGEDGEKYKKWTEFSSEHRETFEDMIHDLKITSNDDMFGVFFDIMIPYIISKKIDSTFLYIILSKYLKEKGFPSFKVMTNDDSLDLKNIKNPLVKSVARYFYGGNKVIYLNKEGEFMYCSHLNPKEKKFNSEENDNLSIFDIEAMEMMKRAYKEERSPLTYNTGNLIYFGVCNVSKSGLDELEFDNGPWKNDRWYIGETSGDWESRHMNLKSMYATHAIQTAISLLTGGGSRLINPYENSKTRSQEKSIQKCDQAFAQGQRWNTRFYLLWKPIINENKDARNTCEQFFVDYFTKVPKKFGMPTVHCLNKRTEKYSSPEELSVLQKVFGSSHCPVIPHLISKNDFYKKATTIKPTTGFSKTLLKSLESVMKKSPIKIEEEKNGIEKIIPVKIFDDEIFIEEKEQKD